MYVNEKKRKELLEKKKNLKTHRKTRGSKIRGN
jgi:hypothetical protein